MNPGAKLGLDQAAPTAAAKQAAKDSEPPTRGQGLYENWIKFLKQLKKDASLPDLALMKTLMFYRRHVDQNVLIDFRVLEQRVIGYKLSDRFGWIRFYTIDGLEISFEWLYHPNGLAVNFDHLARVEVYEG